MRIVLDSNILIRLVTRSDPEHGRIRFALRKIRDLGYQPCAFPQNIAEFWNVCTRPASSRGGYGLTPEQTANRLTIIEKFCPVIPDVPAIFLVWRQLVREYSVRGVQVHDARLVAAMIVHEISEILTLNTHDFRRYKTIIASTPAELAAR